MHQCFNKLKKLRPIKCEEFQSESSYVCDEETRWKTKISHAWVTLFLQVFFSFRFFGACVMFKIHTQIHSMNVMIYMMYKRKPFQMYSFWLLSSPEMRWIVKIKKILFDVYSIPLHFPVDLRFRMLMRWLIKVPHVRWKRCHNQTYSKSKICVACEKGRKIQKERNSIEIWKMRIWEKNGFYTQFIFYITISYNKHT